MKIAEITIHSTFWWKKNNSLQNLAVDIYSIWWLSNSSTNDARQIGFIFPKVSGWFANIHISKPSHHLFIRVPTKKCSKMCRTVEMEIMRGQVWMSKITHDERFGLPTHPKAKQKKYTLPETNSSPLKLGLLPLLNLGGPSIFSGGATGCLGFYYKPNIFEKYLKNDRPYLLFL